MINTPTILTVLSVVLSTAIFIDRLYIEHRAPTLDQIRGLLSDIGATLAPIVTKPPAGAKEIENRLYALEELVIQLLEAQKSPAVVSQTGKDGSTASYAPDMTGSPKS